VKLYCTTRLEKPGTSIIEQNLSGPHDALQCRRNEILVDESTKFSKFDENCYVHLSLAKKPPEILLPGFFSLFCRDFSIT
jgi:hypothetical protein